MNYLWAFIIGGGICAAGQILIDLTGLTPARIPTGYVVAGVVLSALGWYAPLAELAGCGATVPLLGFGHLLAKGVRKAVAEHNEVCAIISEIGEMRKAENPVITGYEFHVLNLVSFTCPKYLILPYLRETLTELKKRKPDPKPAFRARVAIVGSEIDDPQLTKLIEGCGALVVSDRYCFGSTPGREVIELKDDEDALPQICMHIMRHSECARYIADEKVQQRRDTADRLAREYHADGIIYEQMKYCDYWGFERALVSHIMHDEYDWPVLSIDRLYNNGNSGQLRTRVQAFVESLEIKKLHKQNGGAN